MKSMISKTTAALGVIMLLAAILNPAGFANAQDDRAATTVPALKAPIGTIVSKTPTYTWTKVSSATNYQFQVFQGTTRLVDKTLAASVCGSASCSNKPAVTLGYELFLWRARAKVGGVWKSWSAYTAFSVSAPSFSTEFNNSMSGWTSLVPASFWHTDATTLYTHGLGEGYNTSIYRNSGEYTNFDFSARIKLISHSTGFFYGGVVFRGGKTTLGEKKLWVPGYHFLIYEDTLSFIVYKVDSNGDQVLIKDFTASPSIIAGDWNVLRVVAYEQTYLLYINGTLVHHFTDRAYSRGYVGFTMKYKTSISEPTFSVNWAKLAVLGRLADYENALQSR